MLSAVSAFFEHVKPPHIFDRARPSLGCQISLLSEVRTSAPRRFAGARRSEYTEINARGVLTTGGNVRDRVRFSARTHESSRSLSRSRRDGTPRQTTRDCPSQRDGGGRDALDRLRVSRAKHERRRGARLGASESRNREIFVVNQIVRSRLASRRSRENDPFVPRVYL